MSAGDYSKVLFKEPEWAHKHGVFIHILSVQYQSSDEIGQKIIILHNTLNEKNS